MQLTRAVMDERTLKDIAIQQALAQARTELQEKFCPVVVCDDKSGFTVAWATTHDESSTVIEDLIDDDTDRERSDEGRSEWPFVNFLNMIFSYKNCIVVFVWRGKFHVINLVN